MEKIRVLLGNHPMMIPDALRQMIAEQDDMELVSDCRGPMKILQETGRTKADAVILAREGSEEPALCSQLLAVYPDLTIVGINPDMIEIFIQRLSLRRRDIVVTQRQEIMQSLRLAVRESLNT